MIMPIRTDWTLDETVMPEDMNDIGKELNRLKEEDKKLESKKFDKTGGNVNGPVNATNLQVGGNNVYHTDRKPTPSDIGASPVGHSHDDRYFTEAEMNEKLKTKVNVESGKGLSTNDYTTAEKNKLAGIAAGANAYKHPSTHPATMITEDSTHRFVTDTEKTNWNGKADGNHNHDSVYFRKVKDLGSGVDLNTVSTTGRYHQGSNSYATLELNYPVVQAGLLKVYYDGYIYQEYHTYNNSGVYVRTHYSGTWYPWVRLYTTEFKPTPADIGALGATAKAVSAKTADAVAWANVTGRPSTFSPSSHTHTKSQITDMPTALKNPTAIKVQLNGGTTEGTNQFTYDGSAAKTINVTPANIGALASGGTAINSSKLNNKAESSAGTANTIVSRDSAGDVVARLLRTTYADQSTMSGAIAFRTNNSTDNYTRYCNSPSAVRSWLGAITKSQILDMFFPVGTIHFTVKNVNPGTTMGGTWVAWGSGRVPVGVNTGDSSFSTPEKTGGSKTMIHNHGAGTLGANIGAFDSDITSIGYQAGTKRTNDNSFTFGFKGLPIISDSVSNSRINHNTPVYGATEDSSSITSSNLQPYITCYMWKRTA